MKLTHLFKKTPLSWLQVTREKTRLIVAIAGIAFADFLIFTQLGFRDALFDASVKPHYVLNADLVLINPQFNTLFAVKSFFGPVAQSRNCPRKNYFSLWF
jgi:putative ABC transport system permease protein